MTEQNREHSRSVSTAKGQQSPETRQKEIESETWASPIEIDTLKGREVDLGALNLTSMWNKSSTSRIVNTGTRISIGLTGHTYIDAPFLREKYKFVDLTFHYNVDNNNGNEHIIDNKRYAMEAHFLFAHTYTIDITRNLLEAYKLYDDYKTGRVPIPEVEEPESVLHYKPTRRTSPSPSAVTFLETPSMMGLDLKTDPAGTVDGEPRELTPLEIQRKKLNNVEQDVFIERWNKERASRAVKARKPTAYPSRSGMQSVRSALKLHETPLVKPDYMKAEGAKSAVDRRAVKKYETTAKRKAEKREHTLASVEYPAWRRRQVNLSDVNREQIGEQVGMTDASQLTATSANGKISSPKIVPFVETEQTRAELKKIQFRTINIFCCVAIQFELDETAPKYNLFSYLPQVKDPFKEILIDGNVLLDFEEPLKSTEFYVYHGSLTVPPFSTGVQWVLMKNPLKISKKQINVLRSLYNHDGKAMNNNFLGIQAWDSRKIWANNPKEMEPTVLTCPGKDICSC